jgi:hypothetical protein
MPDGAATIKLLNFLAAQPGVILVFHSKNKAADQQHLIQQIKAAIDKHNNDNRDTLVYPNFSAMVDADADKYSGVSPSKPDCNYSVEYGMQVIGYDPKTCPQCKGKSSVRQAVASIYGIEESERGNHHVLDDGVPNVCEAMVEGYQGYQIGEDDGCMTLLQALQKIAQAINPQAYADFMHAQERASALAAPYQRLFGYNGRPKAATQPLAGELTEPLLECDRQLDPTHPLHLTLDELQRMQRVLLDSAAGNDPTSQMSRNADSTSAVPAKKGCCC